jgi:intracellular sulfur oxidation DsrE/DsrF family protein
MSPLYRRLACVFVGVACASSIAFPCPGAEPTAELPPPQFPQIDTYGSVVALPDAGERIRAGGKVYFDTTAAAPAGKPNRGLESAARLVNLYALEGLTGPRPQVAVILHFDATAAALKDEAYAKSPGGGSNPNRELLEKLIANGVEVWVCGQSVIRGGNPLSEVLPGIRIAQSAMTFNINRPADGWTSIGVY